MMKTFSRRKFLCMSGSAFVLALVNPTSASALFINDVKSHYIAPVGEVGEFSISAKTSTNEDATITVKAEKPIQTRANGDPVIEGTYTVTFDTLGTHLEYKVDTNSKFQITRAYDFSCSTVHELVSHNLWHTTSKARLEVQLKMFSVAGTISGWLDFVIRDGKIYVEHNL